MTAKFFEYQVNFTAPGWRFRGAPTRRYPADSNLAFWQKSANLQNHLDIARMAVPRSAQRDDIPPTTGLRNRRTFQILSYFYNARMAELADALDSKSCSRKGVRVRPPLRAPIAAFGGESARWGARLSGLLACARERPPLRAPFPAFECWLTRSSACHSFSLTINFH